MLIFVSFPPWPHYTHTPSQKSLSWVFLYWCARDEGGKGREEEKRRGEVGWVVCVNREEKEGKKTKERRRRRREVCGEG